MRYGRHVSRKSTPQSEPIVGMDQIVNNAGGYVFALNSKGLLERFLTLGTEGGTYYVNEHSLTLENAKQIIEMIKKDGVSVLKTVEDFVLNRRAPKIDPSLFVLALAVTHGDSKTKVFGYTLIHKLCKTSTHLFTFCENIKELRGWSRGLRKAVSLWYLVKSTDEIAYQLVKYRQRNGWTHKDVLRLTHPKAITENMNSLFKYAVGKYVMRMSVNDLPSLIYAYEQANNPVMTRKDIIELVQEYNLTWEMLPTGPASDGPVMAALLPNMPFTAMLRNLNRLTIAGVFDSNLNEATKLVVSRLTDEKTVVNSGVHPINVLNTMKVYASGQGFRGSKTWTPNQAIVDALQTTFELAFKSVKPTGKKILLAVDVSGSMANDNISNMALTPREAAAALAMSIMRSEPNVDLVYFTTQILPANVGRRSSYDEVLKSMTVRGGTDCSVPFTFALKQGLNVDSIIVLTDNETWHGSDHPVQAYETYKKKVNPNVKAVAVGMAANKFSLFPDSDLSSMNVAGFDSAIPMLISNFINKE